jgi:hypothetical protein
MEEDWEENPPMEEDGEGQQDLGLGDDDDEEDEDDEEDILDMGDDVGTNDREALLMRFCPHDSSMLYPQVRMDPQFVYPPRDSLMRFLRFNAFQCTAMHFITLTG